MTEGSPAAESSKPIFPMISLVGVESARRNAGAA